MLFMSKTKKPEKKAMLLKINAKTDVDLIKCSQKIGLTKTALINLAIFEFLEKNKKQ